MITYNLVSHKREKSNPILTAKIIEYRKFTNYFGLNIEAETSRVGKNKLYFSVLVIYQALHLESPIQQGIIWKKS